MSLPPEVDQQALLECLREVLAVAGRGEFLHGPVIRCTPEFFPDEWRPDLDGASVMLRRLLGYAGLGDVEFDVLPYSRDQPWSPESGLDAMEFRHQQDHGAVAFYAGKTGGRLRFGMDVASFGTPEFLAGILAHEIAHAWRDRHGLVVDDREEEEELTDLTTVVLGFGLLTTNNALRARHTGGLEGAYAWTRHSVSSAGYLAPGLMAWLLAVQSSLREDAALQAVLVDELEPSQRQTFKASVRTLSAGALRQALSLPERSAVPYTAPTFAAPGTLPEPEPAPTAQADETPLADIAFRARMPLSLSTTLGFFLVGLVPAIIWGIAWPLLALPAAFVLWSKLSPTYLCSTTGCEKSVAHDAEECPGCGARFVGTIAKMRDKFDAERSYRTHHGYGSAEERRQEAALEELSVEDGERTESANDAGG